MTSIEKLPKNIPGQKLDFRDHILALSALLFQDYLHGNPEKIYINTRPHRNAALYRGYPEYESHKTHYARTDKWLKRPQLKGEYALRGVSVDPDDMNNTTARVYAPPRVYAILETATSVHGVLLGREVVRELVHRYDPEKDIYKDYE